MDPSTALTVLGGAVGSAKLLEKLLGPTADYLGGGAREWTRRGVSNLARIFSSAHEVLGAEVEKKGEVPPRVLKEILSEGPFCEDEISTKYFGGILAASRSPDKLDDRGAIIAQQISRLSTFQVRAHYLFYNSFRRAYLGSPLHIETTSERSKLHLYVHASTFGKAVMPLYDDAQPIVDHTVSDHVMFGLRREELVEGSFSFGSRDFLQKYYPAAPGPGFLISPSPLGAELYLWAHGKGTIPVARFFDPTLKLPEISVNTPLEGVLATGACQCKECLAKERKSEREAKRRSPNKGLKRTPDGAA